MHDPQSSVGAPFESTAAFPSHGVEGLPNCRDVFIASTNIGVAIQSANPSKFTPIGAADTELYRSVDRPPKAFEDISANNINLNTAHRNIPLTHVGIIY